MGDLLGKFPQPFLSLLESYTLYSCWFALSVEDKVGFFFKYVDRLKHSYIYTFPAIIINLTAEKKKSDFNPSKRNWSNDQLMHVKEILLRNTIKKQIKKFIK